MDVLLSPAPHMLSPLSTQPQHHCQAGYSFGAVAPWPLQRCSCGFAGDDTIRSTESLACSSMYCSRLKAQRPCHSCFAAIALVADHRENTVQAVPYLCTRCSLCTIPITLPACWRPPLTFLPDRRCVHRVTAVMWLGRTKNESEDWWQGFLCCCTPCLESAADQLETLAFDCFIQEQTEEFSVSCCLHWEHCVNSEMHHQSDCRGWTTSHCCLL